MLFAEPLWIVAGLFFCIALHLINRHMQKRQQSALQNFAAKSLLAGLTRNVSTKKRQLKFLLLLAVFAAGFLALARPQYGHHWIDVKRRGIDILFAVDTSTSMQVEDIRPNRLERSKLAIQDFVKQLDGDRVGLLPFAGQAFLICPLTLDYSAFEESLQALDTSVIPSRGTNLASAIRKADTILHNDANHKLLIIITDGENLQGDAVAAAEEAAAKDMTIFTVGVGTRQGELIPLGKGGSEGFVKDENGKFVLSRLDEQVLEEIAAKTQGLYAPLGANGEGLQTIYREKLSLIPKEELAEKRHKIPIERFPWFIAAALLLLLVEYLIDDRKIAPRSAPLFQTWSKKLKLSLFLLTASMLMTHPLPAQASPGEDAYIQNDFLTASAYYENALEKDPGNAVLHYNHGTAAYKNNLHEQAIASFDKALQSSDLSLQEKAYYNRGNAQFRKGEENLQADPDKTLTLWENAVASYQAALELQPDNDRARTNLNLVKKKLEELRQQKQQNSQNSRDNNDNSGENDKQNNGQKEKNSPEEQENPQDTQANRQDTSENQQNSGPPQDNQQHQEKDQPRQPDSPGDSNDETSDSNTETAVQEPSQEEEGKMSKEEASQLLEAMRNEEGAFNLVPTEPGEPQNSQGRDW
ncbi:MAG: VWA domain-containing protein [Desulfopila sp.]|jgi:Ca-activated chloride channel family protein|nr:VWA domain-containing protein [Desulfopila sp.]